MTEGRTMNLIKRIKQWLDFSECYKEQLGYKCKHRNNGKECE